MEMHIHQLQMYQLWMLPICNHFILQEEVMSLFFHNAFRYHNQYVHKEVVPGISLKSFDVYVGRFLR